MWAKGVWAKGAPKVLGGACAASVSLPGGRGGPGALVFLPPRLVWGSFSIPASGSVRLAAYSTTGAKVRTLIDGTREKGGGAAFFDTRGLPSGIYFLRLQSKGTTVTRKIAVVY